MTATSLLVTCPACEGRGEIWECVNDGRAGCSHINDNVYPCRDCDGEGEVPADEPLPYWRPTSRPDAGYWQPSAKHRHLELTLRGALVLTALLGLLFGLCVRGGQALMCATHKTNTGHGALRYCPDYQPLGATP